MFLFKDRRFHIEGLSFTIPDGYTLQTEESYRIALPIKAKETGIPRISSTMKNCMTYPSRRMN